MQQSRHIRILLWHVTRPKAHAIEACILRTTRIKRGRAETSPRPPPGRVIKFKKRTGVETLTRLPSGPVKIVHCAKNYYSHLLQTLLSTDKFKPCFADRPGPPLNAVASPYYQGLRLEWRAALFTGGLPVSYSVKFSVKSDIFRECFNFNAACLELPDETDLKKRFVYERGKLYSCVVLMNAYFTEIEKIKCIYSPYTYKVWITAENEVGSANSSVGWKVVPLHYRYTNSKSAKTTLDISNHL